MQSDKYIARVYERFVGGNIYEQALLVSWILVIGLPMGGLTLFRYLFIMYFLSFFLIDTRNILIGTVKSWWLWPFRIVALLSVFWSPYASEALRSSMLLMMSAIVITVVASRFTPQQIIRCVMIACSIIVLYIFMQSVPIERGAGWGSKNYAALFMLTGFVLAAGVALNPNERQNLRWLGALMMPVFAYQVVAANSTTALFMLAASASMVLGMRIFFLDTQRVRHLSSLLVVLGLMAAMIFLYAIIIFVDQDVVDAFLGRFGKDTTFTGRTALWEEAGNQIAMHPYLGVGLEGFWQYDVGSAQTLNENDHKPYGTQLTFHNVHLEVMVHLGLIGYAAFFIGVISSVWLTLKQLLTRHDMPAVAFSTMIAVSLVMSMVESSLWSAFNVQAFLFFVSGAVFARGERRRYVGNLVAGDPVPA